jgi:nucleoside-diphosphate-sugar epimerase
VILVTGANGFIVSALAAHLELNERAGDPLAEFRAVNFSGTHLLDEQAAMADVKRFVFLSSIKVKGGATEPGHAFTAADEPHPLDSCGVSKWDAEFQLTELARFIGIHIVKVRPPLVYGPGVRANYCALMRGFTIGSPLRHWPYQAIARLAASRHVQGGLGLHSAELSS